jgi:hypothetical protein
VSAHQSNQVLGLPVSFDAYIRHGWSLVAIPHGTKGPKTPGWNKVENAVKDSTTIPPGSGVGLCHAYSGTCAIDIDAWDEAVPLLGEHNIDLNALYTAADAVTINSGRAGRGKLIYSMPFGLTLPSKKITNLNGDVVYELRCASANGLTVQDVLPPSYHPDTGKPYQWGGKGKWTDLPTLPVELLTLWQNMVSKDKERVISNGTLDASWDEIRSALYAIPAECSRDDWLSCLMALHYAGSISDQEAQAFHLADDWSSQSENKYKGKQDIATRWKSFRDHPDGVKLGTLFHIAGQNGWKRPTPDVRELFKAIPLQSPAEVINSLRHPVPDIDMSLFPPVLRQRAKELAQSVGCDVLVPLWAGIGAVCGAIDSRSRLELMDGFKVPPLLWVMTIGDPAEKKTPGSTPMFTALSEMERELLPAYKRDHLEWEAKDVAYKSSKKAYLDKAAHADFILSGMDIASLPPVSAEPPAMPVQPRIVVKDITSQKLVRIVAERPRGVLCHLDEMASWVNKMTDSKSGEDRSSWTVGYESNPHVMDRVGEQASIMVENMAVAIYGNIQPKIFQSAMARLGDDGLLQRFIPVPLPQHIRPLNEPIPDSLSNRAEWDALLRTLHALPISTYTLEPSAYLKYREFQAWYEKNKADERILQADNLYLQAYGKLEGLLGRVALVLHLINDPTNLVIPLVTMDNAVQLIRGYIIPAYRYSLSEIAGTIEQSFDIWLLRHIVQLGEPEITMSDIKRSGKRRLENMALPQQAEMIRYSMTLLERAGWAILIDESPSRMKWAINPSIGEAHPGYRLEVIKARQRQLDGAREIAMRAGHVIERKLTSGYDPRTMD